MVKIEVLYPELANLNGDIGNIRYLKKCIPDAEIIETSINEQPRFTYQEDISLIYMGTLSETSQEIVIGKLLPIKDKINELIKNGQLFLFTGNSIEVLGNYIEKDDGSKIEALKIFDIYAKRNMLSRHNSLFLGKYNDIEIVGFKSQFTMLYGNNEQNYFMTADMGIGINESTKLEGIHQNNFFATYVIGPFLILNPMFTLELMKLMNIEVPKLAFENEITEAYNVRLAKFHELAKKN